MKGPLLLLSLAGCEANSLDLFKPECETQIYTCTEVEYTRERFNEATERIKRDDRVIQVCYASPQRDPFTGDFGPDFEDLGFEFAIDDEGPLVTYPFHFGPQLARSSEYEAELPAFEENPDGIQIHRTSESIVCGEPTQEISTILLDAYESTRAGLDPKTPTDLAHLEKGIEEYELRRLMTEVYSRWESITSVPPSSPNTAQ